MKKTYLKPELEFFRFTFGDVLLASNAFADGDTLAEWQDDWSKGGL